MTRPVRWVKVPVVAGGQCVICAGPTVRVATLRPVLGRPVGGPALFQICPTCDAIVTTTRRAA